MLRVGDPSSDHKAIADLFLTENADLTGLLFSLRRKMNKHVNKLSKEAADARKMIEDSDSNSEDSDDENKRNGAGRVAKSGEKPSEDQVEKLEEKLEAAQADQKNLFLIIFQRFIMILSEHLVRCDTDGVEFKNFWYKWTVGRLQQIFMMVSHLISGSLSYLPIAKSPFSIMNKLKSTAPPWRLCSSLRIWIPTFWTFSNNSLH